MIRPGKISDAVVDRYTKVSKVSTLILSTYTFENPPHWTKCPAPRARTVEHDDA